MALFRKCSFITNQKTKLIWHRGSGFGNLVFDILENYENELEKVQEENTKCTIM